jgi:hypothetical protein
MKTTKSGKIIYKKGDGETREFFTKVVKPKPSLKERILLLAPVKQTGQYTFYVCHELVMKGREVTGLSLIAPLESTKQEALRIGMHYNSAKSGLPAYVFRVHYSEHRIRLRNQLANTLCYLCEASNDRYKGHYKVLFVDGWVSREPIFLDI